MNKYLVKIAYQLQEHQERVASRIEKGESVIAAHTMGSGKTLTALEAAKRVQDRDPEGHVVAVVPAPLVDNFANEAKKHGIKIDMKRFHVTSYDKAAKDLDKLRGHHPSLLILDEAHKGRNLDTSRTKMTRKLSEASGQTLMLTGTPSYNKASDIGVLVNTVAKGEVLPEDPKRFEKAFTKTEWQHPTIMERIRGKHSRQVTSLQNHEVLQHTIGKYIDFHDPKDSNPEDFPTRTDESIRVGMSVPQKKIYQYLEGQLPPEIRKKVREGMPLTKKELGTLNSFSTGVRQSSNSLDPYVEREDLKIHHITPKMRTMADNLENHAKKTKDFKGIVYSNYLGAGLRPFSRELTRRGIKHSTYDGSLTQKERDKIVKEYNEGKNSVLLLSSSGGEGLDLKGTRLVQIMEPHFNEEKINQVIGRAIRYKSHETLAKEDRRVHVQRFHSVLADDKDQEKSLSHRRKDLSIDEYLHNLSTEKKDLSSRILEEGKKGFKERNRKQ